LPIKIILKDIIMDKNNFKNLLSSYEQISELVKNSSLESIAQTVAGVLEIDMEELYNYPMGGYSKNHTSGAYYYVLEDLFKHIVYYDWLYNRLEDDISKEVFTHLIQYRIMPDISFIAQAYDGENHQYFDKNIVNCDENEVFVDCGGYIGDTTEDFISNYVNYKKIYLYEPLKENYDICIKNLSQYPNVKIFQSGVGEKNTQMNFSGNGASGGFTLDCSDSESVSIISLDEEIDEKITFLKMDIEGFEIPAIIGAKNHIKNDSPKLAICTYHVISDIWEIPKLIDVINSNYRFYLRHYMENRNWETVLYAIPREKSKDNFKCNIKNVVAMAPYERPWSNVELIKDCGLIPYLLYKNHGCNVTMAGAGGIEYSYLDKYVKGINMHFLQDGTVASKVKYIEENAGRIDCLLLRGCYETNFDVALTYKKYNPMGKIYVGLDANGFWMDKINAEQPEFVEFMNACDLIATSGMAMVEHLNLKWPWKIEHFPNGYYEFDDTRSEKTVEELYRQKENIILTVGRIGSVQKANDVLMEAFANVSDKIPEWKLYLVGAIEDGFEKYINDYFKKYPMLRDRVIFEGLVEDRKMLFEIYRKAKVFALTSVLEGGTPNVISEALSCGCVVAITKIDAWREAIDNGKCGVACNKNSVGELSQCLEFLCNKSDLAQMSKNAFIYSREHFDMEKITADMFNKLQGD